MRPHQLQILDRASCGAISRAGLDEVRSGPFADLAGQDLFLLRQIAGLQNHLQDRAGRVSRFGDLTDFALDVVCVAVLQLADIQHHIQLLASLLQRQLRLRHLNGGLMGAVGETDHRADLDGAALQHFRQDRHVAGPGADAGGAVFQRHLASVANVVFGQVGLQGGMIQHARDIFGGQGHRRSSSSRKIAQFTKLLYFEVPRPFSFFFVFLFIFVKMW